MIKVMVVEDEPPILRDIKNCIEQVNSEFKVIATASNGHQAIALLQNELPDIIFTDIQMPVIDGLELIKHIMENKLDIPVVILSGYSDFSYAKTAMSLGVTEYLLKPVNTDELAGILNKLSIEIKQKKRSLELTYFSKLLDNEVVPTMESEKILNDGQYLIMLFCVGSFPTYTIDYYSPRKDFWKNNNLEKIATKYLSSDESVLVFDGITGAEKVAIFTLSDFNTGKGDAIAGFIHQRLLKQHFAVTIIVSSSLNKVHEIGQDLQSLRQILYKKSVIGLSQIINVKGTEDIQNGNTKPIPEIDTTIISLFEMFARQGELSILKAEVRKLFTKWETSQYPQIWVEKLLKELVSTYRRYLTNVNVYNSAELDMEINEALSISNSYQELFNNIVYIFEELLNKRSQGKSTQTGMDVLMLKIDKYIQTSMAEPINTQSLSEMFGLVPSYLSKLFREYKGLSPIDYLVRLRIEKAKKLIESQPDFFSKDVASTVGYSDPLYFSKIFKKETGMSPSEYRNSCIKNKS